MVAGLSLCPVCCSLEPIISALTVAQVADDSSGSFLTANNNVAGSHRVSLFTRGGYGGRVAVLHLTALLKGSNDHN